MRVAIEQRIKFHEGINFEDWLVAQEAIKDVTGFIFGKRDFRENVGFAYYEYKGDIKEVLPALVRGQKYVWVS